MEGQGVYLTGTLSKSASVCVAHIPDRSPTPHPPPPERVHRRLCGHMIDASPANSESVCQPALRHEIKGRMYVGAAEPCCSVAATTYSAAQKAGGLPAHGRNQTRANEAVRDKKNPTTTFCHRFKSAQSLRNTTSCYGVLMIVSKCQFGGGNDFIRWRRC